MRRGPKVKYEEEWSDSMMPLLSRYVQGERTPEVTKANALYQRQRRSNNMKVKKTFAVWKDNEQIAQVRIMEDNSIEYDLNYGFDTTKEEVDEAEWVEDNE